ncbi:MAG: DUF5652 family protein [Candidatus Moraniibacteriota bacterium]
METFIVENIRVIFIIVFLWSLPWKGVALWKAARNGHTAWFVILLVVNTVALLEIVYIFFFAKKDSEQLTGTMRK